MNHHLPVLHEADVPAITMLVFVSAALAIISSIIVRIVKIHKTTPRAKDQPIKHLKGNIPLHPKKYKPKQQAEQPKPWEKDADWWKK